MSAPANYCFLYQELCLLVCLQASKQTALHSAPLKHINLEEEGIVVDSIKFRHIEKHDEI